MKFNFSILALCVCLTGCGTLLPKRVEFFQDKVKKFPELTEREKETQRQTAALAAKKADETLVAAVSNNCPAVVVTPAGDTARLTETLSVSLGPPKSPYTGPATNLAAKMDNTTAKYNSRVQDFKADSNENAGKKIEDTGLFKIGYFSMWALILGFVALIWVGLKIYGMVNPVVGLGTNVVGRVSSSVLQKGIAQISKAGESFKDYLDKSDLDDKAKEAVKKLFRQAHMESQDENVQEVVKSLTK